MDQVLSHKGSFLKQIILHQKNEFEARYSIIAIRSSWAHTPMLNDADFSTMVASIYDAAADPSRWSDPLAKLANIAKGQAFIVVHDPVSVASSFSLNANWAPEWVAAYNNYYASRNAWLPRIATRPIGIAEPPDVALKPSDLFKTEWYNDYLRPQKLASGLGVTLFNDGTRFTCVGAFTPENEEVEHRQRVVLLQRLTPHFQRAVQINRQLAKTEFQWSIADACFERLKAGVAIVGHGYKVQYVNAAAERIFREGDGLALDRHGRLLATNIDCNKRVQNALRQITDASLPEPGTGDEIGIPRRSGKRPYAMLIAGVRPPTTLFGPTSHMAVVFIRDMAEPLTVRADVIQRYLALTPAEARVVALLASGVPATKIGPALHIRYNTARTLLSRAMEKTQTDTQANLVRIALVVGSAIG